MIGNVYITGQIGNNYDENGNITQKGVELIDVVSQIEPLSSCETINVWINSPGGFVSVGNDIHDYLKGLENVVTIADGYCASIATKIHLSRPLGQRKVVAGTQYMIHNPLMPEITNANTNDLKEIIEFLEPMQKDLVKTYVDSTGTSKEAIQALMDVESSLTDEQLVSLNFVSEIINKVQLKAVAFLDKQVNNKQLDMNKSNIKLSLMMKAMAMLKGREVVAIIQDVAQGTIETPFSDIMAGDPIMLGTEPAPADTYVLADGTQLVVTEVGIVGEIITPSGEEVDYTALETEISDLKAKNEALALQLEEKTALIQAMETEHEQVMAVVSANKSKASSYVPPINSAVNISRNKGVDKVAMLADRRAELQTRKNK